ncbi:WRC domain, Glutamine-Leucine-Glutamine, QLQ, Growth-regulating factor [Artemisia annua]|uniref:Growth-regulating factor n=1 Tax=Artemisia annua TaxID=35608 RepID=A0A2U1P5D4_ARTAN|nr:WRC domain, Glutamine-Leucine-Glutamine, QLQ, Growth-regulating factor [Artemisia annua]
MMTSNHLNAFTAAQWEELEQQALIYKYMVSGVPVPTDLILSVRRSLYNSTFSSSASLSTQPTLGVWEGSYQYNQLYQLGGVGGYGRKIDMEPGRCRRTDGKKWRCAKEAYPDSKYCERHMHRGRNRSRKPVEFSASSSSAAASSSTATTVNVSSSPSATISKSVDTYPSLSSIQTNFMDASSYSNQALKDYRYMQGLKELGEGERSTYFHLNDPFNTQKMAAASSSDHHNYSHFNFQNLKDQQQRKNEETEGQHCFVMGTDFIKSSEEKAKSRIQINTKVEETATKQPFHHFFSTPKTTPNPNHDANWVDAPKSPLSTQELFQSKPRPYW